MSRHIFTILAVLFVIGIGISSNAQAVTITFDEPEANAYISLGSADPLRNDYFSTLGVTFEGSLANSDDAGGWIRDTTFGGVVASQALSGNNHLQFNPGFSYPNSPYDGLNADTEQVIRFSTPASTASLWILWGQTGTPSSVDIVLHAFHEGAGTLGTDLVVDSMNVSPSPATWTQLTVAAGVGEQIDRLELNVINRQNVEAFQVDDLSFTPVPEPASLTLLVAALSFATRRRARSRR